MFYLDIAFPVVVAVVSTLHEVARYPFESNPKRPRSTADAEEANAYIRLCVGVGVYHCRTCSFFV